MKLAVTLAAVLLVSLFCLFAHTSAARAASSVNGAIPVAAREVMRFAGVFTNTQVNVSGHITIELTINADDTLEGNVDFSQFTGGQPTCGSGDFVGTKVGDNIELQFTSRSDNPVCGFYEGVSFTIQAALLNYTHIQGDYSTDTGQQGIVDLRRIFGVGIYMPLVRS